MITKLQKWGNSQGIRVSKAIREQSQISVGEAIEISARKGQITIKPISKIRGKYELKDLVKQLPKNYKPSETEWGDPVGKEEW
tara:strand:- start:2619 stop:2867 length:249 start_codon:yes stop_codon:yes gene_type:complete